MKVKHWRLGVPRALFYYYYAPWWETFLENLGAEVVVSPPTSKEILDLGVGLAVAEACLPVKVYYGHAAWLAPRVEALFVPRLVSVEQKSFICPKLMGLPDMLRAAIKDCPPVIAPTVDLARRPKEGLRAAIRATARALGAGNREALQAAALAGARYREWLARQREGGPYLGNSVPVGNWEQPPLTIGGGAPVDYPLKHGSRPVADTDISLAVGIVGHSYLLYDRYLGMDIPGKVARLGGRVVLPENIDPTLGEAACRQLPKRLYWTLGRKIMGTALHLMEKEEIAGLIHLTAFGCGPDSLVGDLAERYAHRLGKPFLLLTLDEQTGEAGVATRLEAFMDMLSRRRSA
ncbi:acyl-CoA dehydratase activase-related protein [Moorella naiadis]|uniref:acyl-CoA dehydratase activase-related protein n=1 Tax=Moorella naiadis (nom. illeg.) TaxID=3093670 RepID=UPI003D9CB074